MYDSDWGVTLTHYKYIGICVLTTLKMATWVGVGGHCIIKLHSLKQSAFVGLFNRFCTRYLRFRSVSNTKESIIVLLLAPTAAPLYNSVPDSKYYKCVNVVCWRCNENIFKFLRT